MEQSYVWEGKYGKRKHLIPVLQKLLYEQDAQSLEMMALFVNNNPHNLEFFLALSYAVPQKGHIEDMINKLEDAGMKLRNDLTALTLIKELGNRRFNSAAIATPADVEFAFERMFTFCEISELEEKGYFMQPYGKEKQIFISHSSLDTQEVEKLIPYLNAQNFPVWFDKYSIPVSGSVIDGVQQGIDDSETGVFWITKNFLASKWCKTEMKAFIGKLIEDEATIINILDDDIKSKELPLFLRDIKYIRRNGRSVFDLAEEIINALHLA